MRSKTIGDISLRDVNELDFPVLYTFQSDRESNQMAGFSPKGKAAFLAQWKKIITDDSIVKKAVLFRGDVVGYLVSFIRAAPEREVGYWIARKLWGKGLATAALTAFLKQHKDRPLHARAAKHNVASLRILEKCGFAIVGEDKFTNAAGQCIKEFVLELK